ncbi:hypothetical protein [Caldibacillus phage CBP1]|jgi:hypothetical protein|uniref:Fur-regulated basic protein A n=1 Tax=Caldibacillus debilis GB1 TaxID=1339248 RepID=A0A420VIT8_9BACI|nr:Fur-regulated basic protein FbpA [Caldibacillus debilis]ATB52709.1 hypothetical protein [Caldibacillus phage CBP1]RKO63535.1 hypothetical protein Cdeb_02798 [Caldibacillus debilis GB1]
MGVLYDAVEYKRRFIIEELHKMNVYTSRDGLPLDELSYEELKEEWVLASFRQIDVESEANQWF